MTLREPSQVAERAIVLAVFAASALTDREFSQRDLLNWLLDRNLAKSVGCHEQEYLDATEPSRQQLRNVGWWGEAAWTLCWSLSWTAELGPTRQQKHEHWFERKIYYGNTRTQILDAELRDPDEVHLALKRMRNLERLPKHLRLVKRVDSAVLFERLRAINWVTNPDCDWDDVFAEHMPSWH